jgi:D-glycero-alpha-D-manno-heptose-7-phosphate kinase
MIIVRSPLRISFGGGGTDLASYYTKKKGFVISGAINKYVYITITKPFEKGIYLKYTKNEKVNNIKNIEHNIFRETIKKYSNNLDQIEITALADIPSGTGLGSSSSFTNALIKAIFENNGKKISKKRLAELSCDIEINKLKAPIGKQDQFISSYGGLKSMTFNKNHAVSIKDLKISKKKISTLEKKLVLYFTNFKRDANDILKDQDEKSKEGDKAIIENLNTVKIMGKRIENILEKGDLDSFGKIMNEHWEIKKKRSNNMSNSFINNVYSLGLKSGALGGKLVGAGGGGFILFYTNNKKKLKKNMSKLKLREIPFKFDFKGTVVLK